MAGFEEQRILLDTQARIESISGGKSVPLMLQTDLKRERDSDNFLLPQTENCWSYDHYREQNERARFRDRGFKIKGL